MQTGPTCRVYSREVLLFHPHLKSFCYVESSSLFVGKSGGKKKKAFPWREEVLFETLHTDFTLRCHWVKTYAEVPKTI